MGNSGSDNRWKNHISGGAENQESRQFCANPGKESAARGRYNNENPMRHPSDYQTQEPS